MEYNDDGNVIFSEKETLYETISDDFATFASLEKQIIDQADKTKPQVYGDLIYYLLTECMNNDNSDLFNQILNSLQPNLLKHIKDQSHTNLVAYCARYEGKGEFFADIKKQLANLPGYDDYLFEKASNGLTALDTAIESNNKDVFAYLLEKSNKDIKSNKSSLAIASLKSGSVGVFAELLNSIEPQQQELFLNGLFSDAQGVEDIKYAAASRISKYFRQKIDIADSNLDYSSEEENKSLSDNQDLLLQKITNFKQLKPIMLQLAAAKNIKLSAKTITTLNTIDSNIQNNFILGGVKAAARSLELPMEKLSVARKNVDDLNYYQQLLSGDAKLIKDNKFLTYVAEVLAQPNDAIKKLDAKGLRNYIASRIQSVSADCLNSIATIKNVYSEFTKMLRDNGAKVELDSKVVAAIIETQAVYADGIGNYIVTNKDSVANKKQQVESLFMQDLAIIDAISGNSEVNKEKVFTRLDKYFKHDELLGKVLYKSRNPGLPKFLNKGARLAAGALNQLATSLHKQQPQLCADYFESRGKVAKLSAELQQSLAEKNQAPIRRRRSDSP